MPPYVRFTIRDGRKARIRIGSVTVITPGNHDQAAYAEETDYGERTTVLRSTPFEEHVLRDGTDGPLRIIGAPYAPRTTLGQALAGLEINDPLQTILMAHGTLAGAVPVGVWAGLRHNDLIGIGVHDQVRVVGHQDDLPSVLRFLE